MLWCCISTLFVSGYQKPNLDHNNRFYLVSATCAIFICHSYHYDNFDILTNTVIQKYLEDTFRAFSLSQLFFGIQPQKWKCYQSVLLMTMMMTLLYFPLSRQCRAKELIDSISIFVAECQKTIVTSYMHEMYLPGIFVWPC